MLLLVTGIAAGGAAVVARYGPEAAPEATDRPIETDGDGYVSSDTCRPCHPHEYATWYGSYHRTMTQVADPESVVVPFDSTIEFYNREYVLERRGDEFWVDMDMPIARDVNGNLPRFQSPIVMTTGSHHMQLYWYASGHSRLVALLPVIYLIDEARWVPRDSVFLAPPMTEPNIGPRWNTTCIRCHATHGKQRRFGQDQFDTHVSELGISCQACHGPGEEHVRVNRNPVRRYSNYFDDGAEGTITQPDPAHRQALVPGLRAMSQRALFLQPGQTSTTGTRTDSSIPSRRRPRGHRADGASQPAPRRLRDASRSRRPIRPMQQGRPFLVRRHDPGLRPRVQRARRSRPAWRVESSTACPVTSCTSRPTIHVR